MDDYDSTDFDEEFQDDEEPGQSNEVLEAGHVYLLMRQDYRISRNARTNWFFNHINKTVEVGQKDRVDEIEEELSLVSAIPLNPPNNWSPETCSSFKYRILSTTTVSLLARRYRLVFCLDLSPSVLMVDAYSGEVVIDKMIIALQKCLGRLTLPFLIPGSNIKFAPQLYVSVVAHTSYFILRNQQVLIHGWLLTADNVPHFLEIIQTKLNSVESCLARNLCSDGNTNPVKNYEFRQVSYENINECPSINIELTSNVQKTLTKPSPDTSFVNLLRYGILSLQLLPENSSAGIIMISDGIINLPDVHLFQSLLSHLRNSTISCSFLHVGSSHQPGCCWGYESFPDLMRFIASATYGAYIPLDLEETVEDDSTSMRMTAYHYALLVWSFQWDPYALKADFRKWSTLANQGDAIYSGLYYSPNHNTNFEKKQHVEKSINVSLYALVACRLREGYGIRDVIFKGPDNDRVEVALVLPWKRDLNIVYLASSNWPPDATCCHYRVTVEGSYEIIHDLTCPAQKPIKSRFRCNVIKKFLETLQNLSQTDALLAHLHSFASNSAYYTIPENVRSGVPLFYLAIGAARPVLCTSDFPFPRFAEFWEPICMLDINIWQKWMHTHRIEIILVHDKPFPKHLHLPNSNDRFATVQCRHSLSILHRLLSDWSSFVLIENHSYIKFVNGDDEKPPVSFYIIRVVHSKTPCMVIRLAFLGGLSSRRRNEIVSELKEKIFSLTFPSRSYLKDTPVRKSSTENGCTTTKHEETTKFESVQITSCCIKLVKPVEKILIRYEKAPNDYASPLQRVFPSRSPSPQSVSRCNVIGMFSTLGRYLYHQRWLWSAQSDLSSIISMSAVSRILSTLVKVCLQKGFHVAYSCSGVITMVLEVYMQGDASLSQVLIDDHVSKNEEVDEADTYTCVLQHVIFPPHSVSSFYERFSEDDLETSNGSPDKNEHGELQLITECWVEPQHGRIIRTNERTRDLEGLTCNEVSNALYLSDLECISTMLTFEHLNLMCQSQEIRTPDCSSVHSYDKSPISDKSSSNSIHQIPFTFDLMRLLPKCQQTELLFSTLTQEVRDEGSMPNQLLLKLLQNGIAGLHDREVLLSDVDHSKFLQFLLERRKKSISLLESGEELPVKSATSDNPKCDQQKNGTAVKSDCVENEAIAVAHWKCFIKRISATQIVIMFFPATFKDLIKLNTEDFWWRDGNMHMYTSGRGDEELQSSAALANNVKLKYVLPMYFYDCHLPGLVQQLIQMPNTLHLDDILQDHRPGHETGEDTTTIRNGKQNGDTSKHEPPEPRTDEAAASCSSLTWKRHLNRVSMVFSNCFVSTIYQSLQRRFSVCCHDVQYAMEAICNEIALVIDITEFLQTVCFHAKNWPSKRSDSDVEPAVPVLQSWEFPSTFWSSFSCGTLQRVHDLIRTKFAAITRRDFFQVPSNQEYYCYSAYHEQQGSPLKSSCTEKNVASAGELKDSSESVEFLVEETGENADKIKSGDGLDKPVPSFDLESEDDSSTSTNVRSNSLDQSSMTDEDLFDENEDDYPPLFIHLICSISHNSKVSNSPVQTLPTCFKTVLRSAGFKEDEIDELNPSDLRVSLDIVCLTLPPDMIAVMGKSPVTKKGVCNSVIPHDCTMNDCCGNSSHNIDNEFSNDSSKDPLGCLPKSQSQSINKYVEEIKWMLKDEKTSFARDVHPITEDTLKAVADHILNSTSRPGCSANKVPLQFVFGPEQSLDKFIQEFHRMLLQGYQLIHEGEYYYLAIKRVGVDKQCTPLQSSCLASKHLIVQSNPHQDDAAELRTLLQLDEDISKQSAPLETSDSMTKVEECDDEYEDNDEDDAKQDGETKGNASQKLHRHPKERRWYAERIRGKNSLSKGAPSASSQMDVEQKLSNEPIADVDSSQAEPSLEQPKQNPDHRERSSSTEEESSSIWKAMSESNPNVVCTPRAHAGRKRKKSVGTGPQTTTNNGNSTEDGYDGDSSDADNDGDGSVDLEMRKPELPNFWLILHISSENVEVFFQFRDAELDESQLQHRKDVNRQIILHIRNICKIVNQALLLQDLHDTRMCNQLLEPEGKEDIWRTEEISMAPGVPRRPSDANEKEQFVDCQDTYLEATMKFMPGALACPVVLEIPFMLHPRIKTGQGRNVPKVGIKALKTVLTRLSVNNRNNMYVYKEQNGGAVFYLRLHETGPLSSHHPSDYSLGAARPSMTEDTLSAASRSSSTQSLNGNDDNLEANSRINAQEKEHEQSQDTLSLTSCVSSSKQKVCDDVITLSVHGICDAGSEIKEDLVQALQNRLDDAVLEVISVAFGRNPKCKLTTEDVQFIQRPEDPPKTVIHFSIHAQALPFLQVVSYYLKQNLMNFLNAPVYVDSKLENQFHRYHKVDSDPDSVKPKDGSTPFLYIRPQEAGNRGIGCIILSLVDGQGNLVQHVSCPLPVSCAYKDGLSQHEYECLTQTNIHGSVEKSSSKSPGPVALIEFQIWEKGRVDMEQLTERLRQTVRHTLWDFITEYRFLTAPIAEMPFSDDPPVMCSEPSTPLKMQKPVLLPVEKAQPKERAASPLFTVQAYLRELSSSVPDLLQAKCKSPSWSSRGEYPFRFQPNSPPPVPTSAPYTSRPTSQPAPGVDAEVHLAMDAEVLRKQEKYELGEKGILHPFYSTVSERWLEFGRSLGVASVQKTTYNLASRHSVELLLRDLQSVICSLVSDTIPKVFKQEVDGFVPFHSLSIGREKKRVSGTPSMDSTRASEILPGKTHCFCIIARNVRQWRTSSGELEKEGLTEMFESKEADAKFFSDHQKFQPFITYTSSTDESKIVTGSANTNVDIQPPNKNDSCVQFIPRQRLLILFARDRMISLFAYNWSSDKLNKLVERSNKLVEWYNLRSCFLSSIIFQKLGLFLNQPVMRKCSICKLHYPDNRVGSATACKCVSFDLEALTVTGGSMLRRDAAAASTLLSSQQRRNPSSQSPSTTSFYGVLRDNPPHRAMRSPVGGAYHSDPVVLHVGHFIETKNFDTRERQRKLLLLWQDRDARASIPISLLKQISRIEHYCLTPLLFHPSWRIQVATGRDPTLTGLPPDKMYLPQPSQQVLGEPSLTGMRSRHSSGTSIKGPETRHHRKASTGTLVAIPSFSPAQAQSISRSVFPEEWHATMCSAYIGEFVQYLQTLGFVISSNVRQGRPILKTGIHRGKPDALTSDDPTSPNAFPQYLQKFLLGGILLLELVVYEPYFGVKVYSYESMRLRALTNRTLNAQFVIAFLDECDKMKVSMHLHSFTYDYHLRSMHYYISGRQMILEQGYHAVGFLEDFLKYYQKSPNFARNLVAECRVTVGPTMTTAQQLFDYLLKYDRLYDMRAMRMNSLEDGEEPEHVLMQMCTRKVSYRDGSDIRQTDEFDVSLLVARDTPQFGIHEVGDRNTLSLKFFILLTSCREMFPKPVVERPQGTFRAVSSTALPPSRPPSRPPSQPPSRCMSVDRSDMERSQSSIDRLLDQKMNADHQIELVQLEKSSDSKGETISGEQTDATSSTLTNSMSSYDGEKVRENSHISGIREEIVNYMGYFSTHEELMNNIMMEQVQIVKIHIQKVVDRATVDCRRDYLWERLLKSSREVEESWRRRKEEAKESLTMYGLSYTEFADLLRLVECRAMTAIDPRLMDLARMPISWYQTLVKVLLAKYHDCHRHFTAPDGNTQHIVILNANIDDTFILLSIDLHTSKTNLCMVYREEPVNSSTVWAFMEDVVNACCFHIWTSML